MSSGIVPYGQSDCSKINDEQLLHVHDLPQIYTRPPFDTLSRTLDLLKLKPTTFSKSELDTPGLKVHPQGVPHYLTTIISSSLSWLRDDSEQEQIWNVASVRLSERSGRNAMPSMTRSFDINDSLTINLFEPSLTEDKLGLKTWTSSLLLAKRLSLLHHHLPQGCDRVLELGSGTGLVGIAAAALWDVSVILTDLPEIVSNLERNVQSNAHLFQNGNFNLQVHCLDWSCISDSPRSEEQRISMIVAADPIYSPEHPKMLVDAVSRWITKNESARFVVELPLRKGYEKERTDLREQLAKATMDLVEEGTEIGYDDWQSTDGRPAEVECWWSVWKPSTKE